MTTVVLATLHVLAQLPTVARVRALLPANASPAPRPVELDCDRRGLSNAGRALLGGDDVEAELEWMNAAIKRAEANARREREEQAARAMRMKARR